MFDTPFISQYIELHKNGYEIVGAIRYGYGAEEAEKICEEAINNKKKIHTLRFFRCDARFAACGGYSNLFLRSRGAPFLLFAGNEGCFGAGRSDEQA